MNENVFYFWFTVINFNEFVYVGLQQINHMHARGRGLLSPKSYVDVPVGPRKLDFLYTSFSPDYPPISIPFSIENHLILRKLGAFYNNLLKNDTPNLGPIYRP